VCFNVVYFSVAVAVAVVTTIADCCVDDIYQGTEVMEIHSRKTQSARTRTSDQFRSCKQGIMFSSDVTARGMDYPDVTFVLQMGSTTKEQYTHRLGRTARAGKEGSGLLLCAPFEMSALQRDLRDMPLVVTEPPMLAGEVRVSQSVRLSHTTLTTI
jgi:ATP-dependent RNA helicase MSS116